MIDYRGTTVFTYDNRGRQVAVVNPDGSFIRSYYDVQGNRKAEVTPFDSVVYAYDQLNRMSTVTATSGTTHYYFNAVGNRDSVANTNATATGYHYDNLNRLTNVTNWGTGNTVISSFTYTLNNAGIRTAVAEADGSRVDFVYDADYKLTSETRTSGSTGSPTGYVITYTYDNVGNRLTQVKNGVTTTYTYNNRDQLTSEVSASTNIANVYDHAGRLTSKTDNSGTTAYTWLDNDRMAQVSGPGVLVGYDYDYNGQRVKESTSSGIKTYLIDYQLPYGQVVAEMDGSNQLTVSYVYGLERISMTSGASTHTFVADGQGSIRQLTNASGAVTDQYWYTAFGEILSHTGTTQNTFTYTGEAWDANAGMFNLRARLYNPANGRFTSCDPFAGKVGVPISFHRYQYCRLNPILRKDPTGCVDLVELEIDEDIIATLQTIETNVVKSESGLIKWLLTREVLGGAAVSGMAVLLGWDICKQQNWYQQARNEKPVRLQHYTTTEGKNGIEGCGYIRPNSQGLSWYTPQYFNSSEEATDKLATPDELEWYISLNMFVGADKLFPWPATPADEKNWPGPDGTTVHRNGKGLETTSPEYIWINGLLRVPSQWQPFTE